MSKEILIIGVDPPCPRCDLTRQRVERLVDEMDLSVRVRHLTYNDPKAREFADSIGKEFGTAKHVAEKAGIDMGMIKIQLTAKGGHNRPEAFDRIDGPAREWTPEMDEKLRPFQVKAASTGMLMTPILIINGEVRHHGSVPSVEQIRSWLS